MPEASTRRCFAGCWRARPSRARPGTASFGCCITVAGGDRPPRVGDLLADDAAAVAFAGSSAHAGPGDRGRWTLLAMLPERFAVPGTRLRLLASDADRRAEVLGTAGLA